MRTPGTCTIECIIIPGEGNIVACRKEAIISPETGGLPLLSFGRDEGIPFPSIAFGLVGSKEAITKATHYANGILFLAIMQPEGEGPLLADYQFIFLTGIMDNGLVLLLPHTAFGHEAQRNLPLEQIYAECASHTPYEGRERLGLYTKIPLPEELRDVPDAVAENDFSACIPRAENDNDMQRGP